MFKFFKALFATQRAPAEPPVVVSPSPPPSPAQKFEAVTIRLLSTDIALEDEKACLTEAAALVMTSSVSAPWLDSQLSTLYLLIRHILKINDATERLTLLRQMFAAHDFPAAELRDSLVHVMDGADYIRNEGTSIPPSRLPFLEPTAAKGGWNRDKMAIGAMVEAFDSICPLQISNEIRANALILCGEFATAAKEFGVSALPGLKHANFNSFRLPKECRHSIEEQILQATLSIEDAEALYFAVSRFYSSHPHAIIAQGTKVVPVLLMMVSASFESRSRPFFDPAEVCKIIDLLEKIGDRSAIPMLLMLTMNWGVNLLSDGPVQRTCNIGGSALEALRLMGDKDTEEMLLDMQKEGKFEKLPPNFSSQFYQVLAHLNCLVPADEQSVKLKEGMRIVVTELIQLRAVAFEPGTNGRIVTARGKWVMCEFDGTGGTWPASAKSVKQYHETA